MSAPTAQDAPTAYGYAPEGKDNGVVKSKGRPDLHLEEGQETVPLRARKPPWLKVKAPGGENYSRLKKLIRGQRLHTVCEEAHCPNIGECWESGTATFMILGDVCTRACKYCAVAHGMPRTLDEDEPRRVADSGRNDGARARGHHLGQPRRASGRRRRRSIAETIRQIHARVPGCSVEVLIPDFKGQRGRAAHGGRGEAGDPRAQRGYRGTADAGASAPGPATGAASPCSALSSAWTRRC
jgi:hypothetical protein